MQLTMDSPKGNYQIQGYGPGKLIINNIAYSQSMVVSNNLLTPWTPQSITEITSAHFQAIAEQMPEVVLVGTGEKMVLLPDHLFQLLIERNIGFEVMSTAAACRTFTILIAEERKVIAALLVEK